MKKLNVTKIETTFSEKIALGNQAFASIATFDMHVIKVYAESGQYGSDYMGYDKTDVVITFEDGETYTFRYDAKPTYLVVHHFAELRNFYLHGERPDWYTVKGWADIQAEYTKFFNTYNI